MTTKREAHWSVKTKAQNTEKGMCVSLKQPRGDGERYVTPARAAAKETSDMPENKLVGVAKNIEYYKKFNIYQTLYFLGS